MGPAGPACRYSAPSLARREWCMNMTPSQNCSPRAASADVTACSSPSDTAHGLSARTALPAWAALSAHGMRSAVGSGMYTACTEASAMTSS
jgi:hypothetical protein